MAKGITFWALGEMVRERARLRERDDEATTREKIKETVAQWVPDESEREWIEGALLTLLGVEGGMACRPAFRGLAHLLRTHRRAGAGRTRLRGHALRGRRACSISSTTCSTSSRGLPIYVVTLARPDLIERRPDWGAGKRNFVSLYLEPLSEDEHA